MPPKRKKIKSKHRSSKNARTAPKKKKTARGHHVLKSKAAKKPLKKKAARKKTASRARGTRERKFGSPERDISQDVRSKNQTPRGVARSADFRGLSRTEQADSESVDELVEEGNIFEAGAVAGVEEADNQDEREVHMHEVPEDDVPDEYLDEK